MADDPDDLNDIGRAFAALERSRKRVDAIIERESARALGGEPPTISELMAALDDGVSPLTDVERRILIDSLNIMVTGGQGSGNHRPIEASGLKKP